MKKFLIALLALTSLSAFADCIEYNSFSNNQGMYSWCTGDKVYVLSKTVQNKYELGVVTKVSMTRTSDWFNTLSSIKITVQMNNGPVVVVGSHSSLKVDGCQTYSTHNSWDSRRFCVGESVEMPEYVRGTNRPTGHSTFAKIIAVGFAQALVQNKDGVMGERGSFAE